MFAYLEGRVAERLPGLLVIDCGGVGFSVSTNPATVARCRLGETFKVHTYLNVREDGMELMGFGTREEKEMFARLLGVSGIGPKVAMAFLSALTVRDLSLAIATSDTKTLTRAPGVGTKLAQRLILELKDKVTEQDFAGGAVPAPLAESSAQQDAVAALMSLGYSASEAASAVGAVKGQSERTDQLVALALRHIARGGQP